MGRYGAARATRQMLAKLTFAGRSNDEMERELAATDRAFAASPSYAGVAIHDWKAYRARF